MKINTSHHSSSIQFKDLPLGEVFTRLDEANIPTIKTGTDSAIYCLGTQWHISEALHPEMSVISYPAAELLLHEPCRSL